MTMEQQAALLAALAAAFDTPRRRPFVLYSR